MKSGIYIYILLIQKEEKKKREIEQVDLEDQQHRVQGLKKEEKERQRRLGGVLNEEDKERKKKESLKTVYSSLSKYSEK